MRNRVWNFSLRLILNLLFSLPGFADLFSPPEDGGTRSRVAGQGKTIEPGALLLAFFMRLTLVALLWPLAQGCFITMFIEGEFALFLLDTQVVRNLAF